MLLGATPMKQVQAEGETGFAGERIEDSVEPTENDRLGCPSEHPCVGETGQDQGACPWAQWHSSA